MTCLVVDQVANIFAYYVTTVINAIGVFINIGFLIILLNKTLKHKFYESLWAKTFADLVVCIIGVGYLRNSCHICSGTGSYWKIFYNLYIIKIPLRFALFISYYFEIYKSFNRCISLYRPKSTNIYFKKFPFIFFSYLFLIVLMFPVVFLVGITETDIPDIYEISVYLPNKTIISKLLIIYNFMLVIIGILFLFILVTLNIFCIVKFRRTINKSKAVKGKNIAKLDRAKLERRITKTTIIISCLFVVIKILYEIGQTFSTLTLLTDKGYYSEVNSWFNLYRQTSYLAAFSFHSLNSLFYVYMDSNIRRLIFSK